MEHNYSIERQSMAIQVYNFIKKLILSGELKGGERIPEEKVASQFGISRTPIREAMKRLEEYGLIKVKPRSYAVVVSLRREEVEQIALIRAQLEILSVSLLAENGKDADFEALEHLSEEHLELISKNDIAGAYEKDSQFHLEISRLTNNQHLYEIFQKIDAKVQLARLTIHLPINKLIKYIKQHKVIVHAIKSRDKRKAKSLIRKHIMDQLKDYI